MSVDDMKTFVVDTETYYGPNYSVKTMGVSTYIRDEKFKLHGLAIQEIETGTGHEITSGVAPCTYNHTDTRKTIAVVQDNIMVSHNMLFDGFIAVEKLGVIPAKYHDTLSMCRALLAHLSSFTLDAMVKYLGVGEKGKELQQLRGKRDLTAQEQIVCGNYCVNDTVLCQRIYEKLLPDMPEDEMELIHLTCMLFCEPILEIDNDKAVVLLAKEEEHKRRLLDLAGYSRQDLMSNKSLRRILESLGIKIPLKRSLRTGKITEAFAKSDIPFTDLLHDPLVGDIIKARLAIKSTIVETRVRRFLVITKNGTLLMPVGYTYSTAITTRWGGTDKTNMQNLPRENIRTLIKAALGYDMVPVDLAQIEARVLACLADHTTLLEKFAQKRDVYSEFASRIFNRPVDRKNVPGDKIAGFVGKVCILGLGFQMGGKKFQAQLAIGMMGGAPLLIERQEADRIVRVYRTENVQIVNYWEKAEQYINIMASMHPDDPPIVDGCIKIGPEYIELPSGLRMCYPKLRKSAGGYTYMSNKGVTSIYGGKLTENITQGVARVVIGLHTIEIAKKYRIAMLTHDELVMITPNNESKAALDYAIGIMRTPPEWMPNLPLDAEGSIAREYSK